MAPVWWNSMLNDRSPPRHHRLRPISQTGAENATTAIHIPGFWENWRRAPLAPTLLLPSVLPLPSSAEKFRRPAPAAGPPSHDDGAPKIVTNGPGLCSLLAPRPGWLVIKVRQRDLGAATSTSTNDDKTTTTPPRDVPPCLQQVKTPSHHLLRHCGG